MRYTPKTEKEIAEEKLLPEGEYPYQISGALEKTSKSGNDMIELTVRVFKPDGSFVLVTDYLLESLAYKLRHAAVSCGLEKIYDAGTLKADDFIGKQGMLKLGIQKDKNGQYPDRNSVKDYIVPKEGDAKVVIPKDSLSKMIDGDDGLEDEIPF